MMKTRFMRSRLKLQQGVCIIYHLSCDYTSSVMSGTYHKGVGGGERDEGMGEDSRYNELRDTGMRWKDVLATVL